MYQYLRHISQIFRHIRSFLSGFLAEGETTLSSRLLKRLQKRERERAKHPLAQPTRCASHDYLPNLEYNFLISYKIQSTSKLPSRASTLRHFPSLLGFCAQSKRNKDEEKMQENDIRRKERERREREEEGDRRERGDALRRQKVDEVVREESS